MCEDDQDGFTALHYAAKCGNADAVEYLLGLGADPFLKSKKGQSNVHFAVQSNQPLLVAKFLSIGLDIDEID